ncbi:dihydrodipicolinate synthase family protein [Paraburkholderia silviterrae]|uniref:Dihydrodipicolinate synthase family protein n=1 Tax=Paraburkholderia silviterrae TaxID=2528715 RepID=A0A4R5MA35_9BURK|nr:dihydrodipicolinate synthase family protein [Paraburkholderia silviterrae]TDG23425.1 dihydrodipicolinate synthase family protein [Paraburkholderia silviterrae]
MKLVLPNSDGATAPYNLKHTESNAAPEANFSFNRVAYAAAHVVTDPSCNYEPWSGAPAIDWDRTLAFRSYLYGLGFKVAEAMDTAQRGMGVGWQTAAELIRRSIAHARTVPGADLACGAGTDHLDDRRRHGLSDVINAYREQFEVVESAGGRVIMMASRALCAAARSPEDYLNVYDAVISESRNKVVLHWLGEAFDASLARYWGSSDIHAAMATVLEVIRLHPGKIEGIKISLLNAEYERELRAQLPEGVRMYTGDDFNYGDLIAGDSTGISHALLGIFDPIAPVAARALADLARNDIDAYHRTMAPTVALSRELFRAPTQYYKAGVVFLAWLNGHQDHFSMAGGMESARSVLHYAEVFRKADACGVLIRPELAVQRMAAFLSVHAGIGQ